MIQSCRSCLKQAKQHAKQHARSSFAASYCTCHVSVPADALQWCHRARPSNHSGSLLPPISLALTTAKLTERSTATLILPCTRRMLQSTQRVIAVANVLHIVTNHVVSYKNSNATLHPANTIPNPSRATLHEAAPRTQVSTPTHTRHPRPAHRHVIPPPPQPPLQPRRHLPAPPFRPRNHVALCGLRCRRRRLCIYTVPYCTCAPSNSNT